MDKVHEKTLTVRLPADLLAAFHAAVDRNDQSASQVIRALMRDYVRAHAQPEIFPGRKGK